MTLNFKRALWVAIVLPIVPAVSYPVLFASNSKPTKIAQPSAANSSAPPPCNTCLRLVKSSNSNSLDNPLYTLEAYSEGKLMHSFNAVTGRAYTQTRNRDQSGTEAPLPDGNYSVSSTTIPGASAEVGEIFLPVYPQFQTGRSALGIHYDPSFNKSNGEDGTAGCIALTNKKNRDAINQFVASHKPQLLIVKIQ